MTGLAQLALLFLVVGFIAAVVFGTLTVWTMDGSDWVSAIMRSLTIIGIALAVVGGVIGIVTLAILASS